MEKKKNCSIRELAASVGLSTCTVSKVLNGRNDFKIREETRRRVFEAAARLNYVPNINAQRLFLHKSHVIGLLVPSRTEGDSAFADHHFVDILAGMEQSLSDSNYSLLLLFSDPEAEKNLRYLNLFRSGAFDGLLIWGARRSDRAFLKLEEYDAPHLFITSIPGTGHPNYVTHNYAHSTEILTRKLIDSGCRDLLFLAGPEGNSVAEEMLHGVVAATEGRARFRLRRCAYQREEARRETAEACREQRPDGVIAASSGQARGACDVLPEAPRVMLDSSRVTFEPVDCLGAARTDDCKLGRHAIEGLIQLIESPENRIEQTLPLQLML